MEIRYRIGGSSSLHKGTDVKAPHKGRRPSPEVLFTVFIIWVDMGGSSCADWVQFTVSNLKDENTQRRKGVMQVRCTWSEII